jgi:hypothetical protein
MPERRFKFVKTLALAGGVILLCLLAWALRESSRPMPRSPLPNPNGYDEFVKAARMLTQNEQPLSSLTREQLSGYIAANAEALKLARGALTTKSKVPVEYTPAYMSNHFADLVRLKGLALALAAEAKLALMEKRTNDASVIYLDAVRFGHEAFRGGFIIDSLVGMACEAIGLVPLQGMGAVLDGRQCVELVRQLEGVDASAEPFDQIMAQEKSWARRQFGIKEKINALLMSSSTSAANQKAEQKWKSVQLQRRTFILALAARAYELETGRLPAAAGRPRSGISSAHTA